MKRIINADQARHSRLRRAIAPVISDRAIREQEGFSKTYGDKLVACLRKELKKGESGGRCGVHVYVMRWVSLTTSISYH
jgi:hypothetical protein